MDYQLMQDRIHGYIYQEEFKRSRKINASDRRNCDRSKGEQYSEVRSDLLNMICGTEKSGIAAEANIIVETDAPQII